MLVSVSFFARMKQSKFCDFFCKLTNTNCFSKCFSHFNFHPLCTLPRATTLRAEAGCGRVIHKYISTILECIWAQIAVQNLRSDEKFNVNLCFFEVSGKLPNTKCFSRRFSRISDHSALCTGNNYEGGGWRSRP